MSRLPGPPRTEAGPSGKQVAPGQAARHSRVQVSFPLVLEKSVPGLQGDPASETGARCSPLIPAAQSFQPPLVAAVGKMLPFHSPDRGGWQVC